MMEIRAEAEDSVLTGSDAGSQHRSMESLFSELWKPGNWHRPGAVFDSETPVTKIMRKI
jgi:hypothetical protein